jgi:hypothetical protein
MDYERWKVAMWDTDAPVCNRYWLLACLQLDAYPPNAMDASASGDLLLVGCQRSGPFEAVSYWQALQPVCGDLLPMLQSLRIRGAESIRYLLSDQPAAMRSAVRRVFPGAIVIPAQRWMTRRVISQVGQSYDHQLGALLRDAMDSSSVEVARARLPRLISDAVLGAYPPVPCRLTRVVTVGASWFALSARQRRRVRLCEATAPRGARRLEAMMHTKRSAAASNASLSRAGLELRLSAPCARPAHLDASSLVSSISKAAVGNSQPRRALLNLGT